jgi:hypothetical protein
MLQSYNLTSNRTGYVPIKGKTYQKMWKTLGKAWEMICKSWVKTTSLPGEAPVESILDSELGEFYG